VSAAEPLRQFTAGLDDVDNGTVLFEQLALGRCWPRGCDECEVITEHRIQAFTVGENRIGA
jgi:hypothetical protein